MLSMKICRGFAMNAINVIAPYKSLGMWVFDDPRVGLVQEPFVSGADSMIDRVVADIPDAVHGFTFDLFRYAVPRASISDGLATRRKRWKLVLRGSAGHG